MEETTQRILNLVKKKMAEQAAFDRDAYKQYVEETIDYYVGRGELTDDDNLEFLEDKLLDMYQQVQEELGEE